MKVHFQTADFETVLPFEIQDATIKCVEEAFEVYVRRLIKRKMFPDPPYKYVTFDVWPTDPWEMIATIQVRELQNGEKIVKRLMGEVNGRDSRRT